MKMVRVGDLAKQIRGVTFAKADSELVARPGLLPVLRAGNIHEGQLSFDDLVYVPEAKVKPHQKVQARDVLVTASSGSLSVVGKAAQSHNDFDGGFGAFLKVLRPGPEVHSRYFAHFFQTPKYRAAVSSVAAGANINNLKNEHLNDLEIPLPPLDEQRRVAAILDKADAIRQKHRQAIAHLDTLTQSVFHEMFGATDAPVSRLGESLEFLTSGSRGWARYYTNSGDLFLRIQNVGFGQLILDDLAHVDAPKTAEARRTKVEPGDVLVSITADLGRSAVFPNGLGTAFINQHLAILRAPSMNPRYLSTYLTRGDGYRQLLKKNRGATKAGLNFDDIRSVSLPIPTFQEQDAFASRATRIDSLSSNYRSLLRQQDALFASLQSRAFRGEL